jgi:hypothetical protein
VVEEMSLRIARTDVVLLWREASKNEGHNVLRQRFHTALLRSFWFARKKLLRGKSVTEM